MTMTAITGKTQLLGVIGHPVSHSLSPVMHNAALTALGLDWRYVAFPIAPNQLATAIAGLWASGIHGLNVTIPHKQAIIPHLTQVSFEAQQVGAVNTLWRDEQGWQGTNTDVAGFTAPLQSLERDWANVTPVILGNGGAARAVVVGCYQLGCRKIIVVGRNAEKLQRFQRDWSDVTLQQAIETCPWNDRETVLPSTELLINTTPIGMGQTQGESPVSEALLANLPPTAITYDLIYNPRPTYFLQLAQARGLLAIDGSEMLVQQGAVALALWLQQRVPVGVMREALLAH